VPSSNVDSKGNNAVDQSLQMFQKEKFIDGTIRYGCSATIDEPRDLSAALKNINWKVAMDDEFNALIKKQYLKSCTAKQSKECDRLQMSLQGKKES
jgi:hypothetical protein